MQKNLDLLKKWQMLGFLRDDSFELRKRLKNGMLLIHKSRLVEYMDSHAHK